MANENAQDTITELNALLSYLRSIGLDVSTITLPQSINILTRFKNVLNEELNTE